MACDQYATLIDALEAFAFHDAVACYYTNTAGTMVTGMMTFGAVALALGFRTGGISAPAVLTLLTGAVLLPFLPGAAMQITTIILLFAIGVGPVLLLRRMGA